MWITKCKSIVKLKNILSKDISNDTLEIQLLSPADYTFLPTYITKLQKQSLSIHEQMEIYTSTESKLNGAPLEKFLASKGKNPDLLKFTS